MAEERELKEAFKILDKEGFGKIPASDVAKCLRYIDYCPDNEDVRKAVKSYGDSISLPELQTVLEQIKARCAVPKMESIPKLFEVLDKQGKGTVSVDDLKVLLTTGKGESLTQKELDDFLKEAPKVGDHVEYGAFCKTVTTAFTSAGAI